MFIKRSAGTITKVLEADKLDPTQKLSVKEALEDQSNKEQLIVEGQEEKTAKAN